ncbi:MAG: thioredoxin [Clostridia bacterium]|nr:thioredoxin [Clostridia bacterium]
MVKHVTSAELEELVATSNQPVVCDFWASWCGPCRMLAPVFEEVSKQYEGKAVFVKVNVDEEESAAYKYGISSIPNVLVFKDGQKVDGSLDFVPAAVLSQLVDRNL